MARPSATAFLLLLALSLLAVAAHCRTLEADDATTSELESSSAVAVSDENGELPSSNPTLPADASASSTASATEEADDVILPAVHHQQHEFDFLRLPSHRLRGHRRPCSGSLHRHQLGRPRHLHHGERPEAMMMSHFPILPAEEAKAVAEPDPDRSLFLPDTDGEAESSSSFVGGDEDSAAAVRAWKKEMMRRWVHFHLHHHGGMGGHHRLHHHVHVHRDEDQEEEAAVPEGMEMKRRFQFRHPHHDGEDDEKNMMGKRFLRQAELDGDEDEQVEEMVRRFRKAIMMRRRFGFGHGHGHGHGRGFFHHSHSHRGHAEEAEKEQADGEEDSGVMAWVKGLMNRF